MISREDARKLLGGYATGTLTPEEQAALFEAALHDQELFDGLAREQALRDALADPSARAQLLAALDQVPAPWYRRWLRPLPVGALAAALAAVAIVAVRQSTTPTRHLPLARLEFPPAPRPLLPPPPEISIVPPASKPLTLPGVIPAAPPPPEPAAAVAELKKAEAPAAVRAAAPRSLVAPKQARLSGSNGFADSSASPPANPFGNTFLPNTVEVRGTVTDTAGSPVGNASVQLKLVATGETATTTTNQQGEFRAPELPGQNYEIRASAPGFQTKTVSAAMPATGLPAPVNLQLQVGAVTDSVVVGGAQGAQLGAAGQAGGRGGRASAGARGGAPGGVAGGLATPPAPQPAPQSPPTPPAAATPSSLQSQRTISSLAGVRPAFQAQEPLYRILRRMPDGALTEIPVNGDVPKGSTMVLRITPPIDSDVEISRGGKPIFAQAVSAGRSVDIPLPAFEKKEHVSLNLVLTARAASTATAETVEVKGKKAPVTTRVTVRFNVQ